jgi:hypothetical protein
MAGEIEPVMLQLRRTLCRASVTSRSQHGHEAQVGTVDVGIDNGSAFNGQPGAEPRWNQKDRFDWPACREPA